MTAIYERICRGDSTKVWMTLWVYSSEGRPIELVGQREEFASTKEEDEYYRHYNYINEPPPLPAFVDQSLSYSYDGFNLLDQAGDDGEIPDFEDQEGYRGEELLIRIGRCILEYAAESIAPVVYFEVPGHFATSFSALIPEGLLSRLADHGLDRWRMIPPTLCPAE